MRRSPSSCREALLRSTAVLAVAIYLGVQPASAQQQTGGPPPSGSLPATGAKPGATDSPAANGQGLGSSITPNTDASTQAITGQSQGAGTAADDGGVGQQGAAGPDVANGTGSSDVVVTGYRRSLEDSALSKKNATNFIDSIYAEDVGKFPDLNLTESLQRLPGVQISRDASGEGTYINVRGLSAGFTVTTINGFPVNTSSNGGNEGRGSSLDIFPSEFFRRLTLSKSPTANTVEGGTAGVVDLQPLRAFDRKGFHINVQAQDTYQDVGGNNASRAALIVSDTVDTAIGQIGILAAGAYAGKSYRSEIFNTVGYTTLNIAGRCPATTRGCNSLNLVGNVTNPTAGYGGGAGATLATVPTGIPSSLNVGAAGSPLVECLNGAAGGTSGLSCQDLSYAIVPRLVRAEQIAGNRDRSSGLLNVEWRPRDWVRLRYDTIVSESNNNFGQYDLMATIRSYNNTVPVNFTLDNDKVLTGGTFANTYFLNQSVDARTKTSFYYRALSSDWDIARRLRLSTQVMINTGRYRNLSVQYTLQSAPPQIAPAVYTVGTTQPGNQPASNLTPLATGQTATYSYTPGDLTPKLTTNVDLPNYSGYYWNGIQITPQFQRLDQRAARGDLVWGDAEMGQLSIGYMKTKIKRNIYAWNVLDCAWRGACGTNIATQYPSVQEAIPNSAIPNFLTTLPSTPLFKGAPFDVGFNQGWRVPDFDKINSVVNYNYFFYDLNPGTGPTNYLSTYSPRILNEDTDAAYIMGEGKLDIFGRELRYNGGLRYTQTKASVAGIVNDYILLAGSGTRVINYYPSRSHNWLPSLNLSYLITDNLVVRGAGARTVTRPNPSDLAPTFGLSLDGDTFTQGNPGLRPFYANNFDAGLEWYPQRGRTVLTANLWWKSIYNYPAQIQNNQLFTETGINFARLSARQQAGITNLGNGDPNNARLIVIQRQNSDLVVHLFGQEFQWVQPLDFLVKGVGFNANVTHIEQHLSGVIPASTNPNSLISGLAPWTYNGTLYYERRGGFSVRASFNHRDANLAVVCPCNNIPGDLYSIATNYMDAQVTLPFPWYKRMLITVQAQKLLKQVQLNRYLNRESEPDGATYAGRTFVIGLRADF